ncbi:ABC transporter ATP-binding protein [Oceanibacterium hippocampi]|uniref:High-affinity branched-chain amino acid transport ATP-binding protein LivF n=1 Tax=Oceanibacterium hippocampi TaxID=745714 RepID=A0A1Y5TI92_9PROT|nr:ABC transporter ATP-binding protein [Oceanibacterium hippocampi]SLN64307.1 High-affinity branched-chain amino acid transport ATP-binding protein LivF [Oceanibacterium hippocampi]
MSLLELRDIAAGYGEIDIVSGIAIHVEAAEIVTVAGTNGAGKSTVAKTVTGIIPRCRGVVEFDGRDIIRLAPETRVSLGLGYVPQVANVFPSLTVLENLQVMAGVRNRKSRVAEMMALFPGLAERRMVRAGALSGGERQQLAFARALMPNPKLLVLDEPTAALSPALAAQVFDHIRRLPGLGVAALVIEQRARQSLEISDRGYILDLGRVVMQGKASDILANPDMAALYLGQDGSTH